MRTVSDEFKALWQRKLGNRDRLRLGYKRSYYNGSSYVNEAAYTYLEESEVVSYGTIPMQLDSPLQNIMRTSIVSVRVNNTRNQWIESANPPSFFAADATATSGYRLYKTIFVIQVGYLIPSTGLMEWVSIFTGLGLRARPVGSKGEAEVLISSKALLLEKSDAEETGTVFTLENCVPATGNGTRTDFETTSLGVDHVTALEENAVALTQGEDWRFSNSNQVAGGDNTGRGALVTTVAPANLATMKVSGVKWAQGQTIEEALADICDVAGITSGERSISPILFPGGLSSTKLWDVAADWQAGVIGDVIDVIQTPGNLKMFAGGFSQSPANSLTPWTLDSGTDAPSVANGYIEKPASGSFGSRLSRSSTDFYGRWLCDLRMLTASAYTGTVEQNIGFAVKTGGTSGGEHANQGYWLNFTHSDNVTVTVHLYVNGAALTSLGNFTFAHDSAFHTYKITRTYDGEFKVYMDGVLKLTVTDTEHTTNGAHFAMQLTRNNATTTTAAIDNIEINSSLSEDWVTAVHDMGTPISIGAVTLSSTIPSGSSVTIETQTSTSNAPFNDPDGWVAVGVGGQVESTLRRYIKVRARLARTSNVNITPDIESISLGYSTTSVTLALSNHAGKRCVDALERYVALPDYEAGFDGDGLLFVRSKTVSGTPAIEINQENGLIEVTEFDPGIDRIYNVGRVRYQDNFNKYDGTDAAEAAPTSETKWGRIPKDEDFSDILLANDPSIGASRARLIYERYYRPRRRIRATIWFVPWLELSDIVRLSVYDHPLLRQVIASDPLQLPWGGIMAAGEAENVLARDLDMKVVEYKPNLDTNIAEVLLEEVLS